MNAWVIPRRLTGAFSSQLLKWCSDREIWIMNTKIGISIIWLIFSILFFSLAGFHFVESQHTIPKIEVRRYPSEDIVSVKIVGVPIEQRLFDFGDDFNKFVNNLNESNRKANLYAGFGYILAGFTAVISLGLECREHVFTRFSKKNM